MSALAPLLEALFTERLIGQRDASPHTIAAYRDTYRQLLRYTADRAGRPPEKLDLVDLDASTIGAFLQHLEDDRHVSVRTRNLRLTAIRTLFHFAAYRHPDHAALIQRVQTSSRDPAETHQPQRRHLPRRIRNNSTARRPRSQPTHRPTRSRPAPRRGRDRATSQ